MSRSVGFLYILSNEFSPGLLKIGFTTKSVEERALELYTTGVPAKFKIEYKIKIVDPQVWESKVHKALNDKRINKEWFKLSVDEAVVIIGAVVGEEPIHMVKIIENDDTEKIIADAVDLNYDYYVNSTCQNREIFYEVLHILVDYFYAKCKEDIFKRTGFIDSINGNLKKSYDKLVVFKSASISSIKNIIFNDVKSKSSLLADYLDSHRGNVHSARRIYETALANSNYIFPAYSANSFYMENIGLVYDALNDKVKYRPYNDSRHLGEIIFDSHAAFIAKDVVIHTVRDPVLSHLVQQIKSDYHFYDYKILKNQFSCFNNV
jgi:hypothetical protein